MKSAIRHVLFVSFASLIFGGIALAAHTADTGMNAADRESRLDPKTTVAGTLICEANAQTQGDTCDLELQDDSTGKVYQIKDNNQAQAMQMYRAGQTNVAIQGHIVNGETLVVKNTQKL